MNAHRFQVMVLGHEKGMVKLDFGKYTPFGNTKKQINQYVLVAQKFLPPKVKAGDKLILEFYTPKQIKARDKNTAQAILDELLSF